MPARTPRTASPTPACRAPTAHPSRRGSEARASGREGDDQLATTVGDGQRLEPGPRTRSLHADPGVRREDRAVGGADQVSAVLGEELVGPRIERGARVRAAVDVGVIAAVVVDEEAAHGASARAA